MISPRAHPARGFAAGPLGRKTKTSCRFFSQTYTTSGSNSQCESGTNMDQKSLLEKRRGMCYSSHAVRPIRAVVQVAVHLRRSVGVCGIHGLPTFLFFNTVIIADFSRFGKSIF